MFRTQRTVQCIQRGIDHAGTRRLDDHGVVQLGPAGDGVEDADHRVGLGADEELEEERRLFYVAVTRAKRHLYLTYPINIFDKGSGMLLSKPTRFLDPVSPDLFDQLALVEEGYQSDWGYGRGDF